MNTAFHHDGSGYGKAANDPSSCTEAPLDGDLVPVLASRASVRAAAAAMGHKSPGEGTQKNTGPGGAEEKTAEEEKKDRDKAYRKTERQDDAKGGIKLCPVKLPVDLHQSLRRRVNEIYAPEGSRVLLAFAAFALRPELTELLHAIELRADRGYFPGVAAGHCAARLACKDRNSSYQNRPETAERVACRGPPACRRNAAQRRNLNAILALYANPTLQKVCAALRGKAQTQAQFLHMALHSGDADFLSRMSPLSPGDREFLLKLLNLDEASKRAIAGAAQHPEIIHLVLSAAGNRVVHEAIQTAAQNPAVARMGLAVIRGKGLVGWIARKATHVLLRRQQKL